MSEQSKTRWSITLSIVATLIALATIAVNAGIYSERIDQNSEEVRKVRVETQRRIDRMEAQISRMDSRIYDMHRLMFGDKAP